MATNSSADVLIFCGSEQFCSLLGDDSLEKKKGWVELILFLINNALSCETHHHYKHRLVSVLLENEATFFSKVMKILTDLTLNDFFKYLIFQIIWVKYQ